MLNYCENFDLNPAIIEDNVERIDEDKVPLDHFVERYEKIYKPVVVTGVTDSWKASHKWTLAVSS